MTTARSNLQYLNNEMTNSYNIERRRLWGRVVYEKNRKITKEFKARLDANVPDRLPIDILFISNYPLILKDGYEFFREDKWYLFSTELITYVIMEAYLEGKIRVVEFHDNTRVLFDLVNETNVGLAIIPGDQPFNESSWIQNEILIISEYESINNKSGSTLDKQIEAFISEWIDPSENPYKDFSEVYITHEEMVGELYSLNHVVKKRMLWEDEDFQVVINSKEWNQLRQALVKRMNEISAKIKQSSFLTRLHDAVQKSVSSQLSRREITSD